MSEELKNVSGIDLLVNEKVRELTALREEVKEEYGPLTGIATTPDNLAERKKDKAAITKKKKAVNDERIAFEKRWKEAIAPISEEYKAVTGLLTLYEDDLKSTLEEFELQRIIAKKQIIESIFFDDVEKAPEVADWLTLTDVYNPKWENATYAEKDIRAEIEQAFATLKISYDNVVGMNHTYQEEGLKVLKDTKDFMQAVSRMNELAEQQRIIEEKQKAAAQAEAERLKAAAEAQERKRQEEERKKLEEMSYRERAEMAMDAAAASSGPLEEFSFRAEPEEPVLPFGEPTLVPAYIVTCTCMSSFELEMLKRILDDNNIKYTLERQMIEYVD